MQPNDIFKRFKKAIVSFEAIGEKRWRTGVGRLWARELHKITKEFLESVEERGETDETIERAKKILK